MKNKEYKNLNNMNMIIKSIKTPAQMKANSYMKKSNEYLYKCVLLDSILRYYNYKPKNKLVKKVFFAYKEIFSSNFKSFHIQKEDYLFGYLPNVECNMIKDNDETKICDMMKNLHKEYNVEYYILNAQNNNCEQVKIPTTIIDHIEISELDINKLYDLFLDLKVKYVFNVAQMNLHLYKIPRIKHAEDTLTSKIIKVKRDIYKQHVAESTKGIFMQEGGNI